MSDILSGGINSPPMQSRECPGGGFDYITRGTVPPNPAELLMHPRFGELLKWGGENYDLVIIDTPPVLAVTDAVIIGNYSGTTLLVARFRKKYN
ncbi:hypothetical protein MJ580_17650 [Klebsiella pneumoniae]|nr:hypothetical protein MJ580_17650 [Klebsiella pneumoniae]